mgnify:CR=1 FL=1
MKSFFLSVALIFCVLTNAQETFNVNGTHHKNHNYYAFTNATIYIDYQTKIENATLLIKDGKVEAVGTKVDLPANVVRYNLDGKYIYPSLIDMYSDYGMPAITKDKTRNLLFGIWSKLPKHIPNDFQRDAANLLMEYSELNLVFHWGMMLAKYPFFKSVVEQIGRLTKLNDSFLYSQLEQRITENYGDTSTIKRSMQFVVRTLMNLELLANPKQGIYQLRKPIQVNNPSIKFELEDSTSVSSLFS